tara:strand:+ start:507 stop:623 length:117 start_codon:yes stop_codon:yes gene_type:complete
LGHAPGFGEQLLKQSGHQRCQIKKNAVNLINDRYFGKI